MSNHCSESIGRKDDYYIFCKNDNCERLRNSSDKCCFHSSEATSWCENCHPCNGNFDSDFDEERRVWKVYQSYPKIEPKIYIKEIPISRFIGEVV